MGQYRFAQKYWWREGTREYVSGLELGREVMDHGPGPDQELKGKENGEERAEMVWTSSPQCLIPVTVGQRRGLSFHTLNFYISIDDSSFTSLSSRPIAVFTLFIKSAAASASSELLPATSSNNPLASSRSPPSNT